MDYKVILKAIKDKNVELRHDVDLSLISAYRLAFINRGFTQFKPIYYVRFDCDYYNPLSVNGVFMLNCIKAWGGEIGLHVDSSQIKDKVGLISYLDYYNSIYKFDKFTFHINSEHTKGFTSKFYGGYENKSIVSKYISDSRGEFNQTKLDWIKDNDNFTLLIHPEWWMHEGTKEEIIAKAIKEILP